VVRLAITAGLVAVFAVSVMAAMTMSISMTGTAALVTPPLVARRLPMPLGGMRACRLGLALLFGALVRDRD
jgi:hypothetical protein